MKKCLVTMTILVLVAVLAVGCEEAPSPSPGGISTEGEVNFRLLISDEVNAIEDFASLNVTITGIGAHQVGGEDGWIEPEDFAAVEVDLKPLQGENATEIWNGHLDDGEYNKVFIYVSDVAGILNGDEDGEPVEANVKLPSGKLQISKPFTISSEGQVINFVFDITVVEAGKSGQYILQPQIAQSGPDQEFTDVTPEGPGKPGDELQLQLEGELGLGMEVTLIVSDEGSPVEGATVTVNGEGVGSTGVDGRLTIELPDTPGEVKIEATLGDKSGELEIELEEQGE